MEHYSGFSQGDTSMTGRNKEQSASHVAILSAVIILSLLQIVAGCTAPPGTNTTPAELPACSADTGVCPVMATSVRIETSPQMYSPFMSSTPGIRLTSNVSGFNPAEAEFAWNASYGHFLSWGTTDYTIRNLPPPVINHGETIYWSFSDPVSSTLDPVIISVTARNTSTGMIWGSSDVTLVWEGNFTVRVQQTG
jgi:hypothetical protein